MATETIVLGDVVYLKSGSPALTADHLRNNGQIECHWFEGSSLLTGYFTRTSLTKDKPKAEVPAA